MQKKTTLSTGEPSTITVSVPDHKELRIGTLSKIIRKSKLPKSAFN